MGTYNNRNNNNNQNNEEKKIKIETSEGVKEVSQSIKLDFEPDEFPSIGKTTRISNINLSVRIKEKMQKKMHDCVGALVSYTNNFNVDLYFENNALEVSAGKFKNVQNLTINQNTDRKSIFEMNKNLQSRFTGKTFVLNDVTMLLLSDYCYGGRNAYLKNKKQWEKEHVYERRVPAGGIYNPTAERIILGVRGLDIRVLCNPVLYGNTMVTSTTTDTDGNIINKQSNSAFYECRFSKAMPDGSFMINIEQFDRESVDIIARKENPQFVQNNGILMY